MSNTNEILKHIITAPELNSTEYANNLKGVFDNINDNFVTLANRDFVKGERGSSVEIVEYDIFDNTLEEPNYTEYGNLLINAIKNRPGYSKNNEYITSNDVTVSLFDNLGSKAGKLKMICNITSEDGVNFSYLPVSSLYYVFLDGRFANDKINKMDESVFTDIEDLSCVLIYNVNENGKGYFEVLDNAFPTIYYEKEVGLCWKLNGNNTGIPVKGPQGKAGENAKLYIVKSDKEINQSTSNTFEIEITHIFDTNGFTAINDYIKNNTDILKINTQYACAIYCNLGSGYNYYFGTLKYDNNKVIAISDSTIGIDTLVQLSTLENLFKNINLKNNDGYNAKGIYLPIEKQGYTQKVHLLTASSISNTEGNDTELNTDIIWSPVSDINTLKIDDSNKLQVDKYLYLKIDTELLTEKLKDVYNNETVTDDFVRIIKNAFKHRNNILKYKLVNVINPNVSDGSIVGSNVFGNYTNNNNVSLNTNNTLNLNGSASAKCLINTKINSYNAIGEISDSYELGPVIDITNLKNYGKHINISKDENENTLVHKELKYTDFNNIDFPVYPIGVSKKDEEIGENTTVTPKFLTKENVNEYTVYEEINNIDNYLDRYSNMPFEFGDLIFNDKPNKKGIYRWVLDFTYNEFDPIELKESNSGTIINSAYNNIFVDDGGASKNINALNIYALFNTIFTTSISPIESDNILWFNGIFKKLTIKGDEYLSNSVEGWELNPDIFKFYKFNPAFNNSYSINQDTSLNLNYNVNITGDTKTSKKNLNVLGDITAENLQIFGNANIDKIENIYTGNDIIGDNGIKIGKNTENDSYYTEINSVGVVKCSDIISNNITSNSITSDNISVTIDINANCAIAKNLNVNNDKIALQANSDVNGISIEYINQITNSPNICVNSSNNKVDICPNNYSKIIHKPNVENETTKSINNHIDSILKESDSSKKSIFKDEITLTNTINRINVNDNESYYGSGLPNTGVSGSAYSHRGHAGGPYYSDWGNKNSDLGDKYIGSLSKKHRFYRYTLYPYFDITTDNVSLMSTPIYSSEWIGRITDAPYITNICQIQIPLVTEPDEPDTEKRFLNGLYEDKKNNIQFSNPYSNNDITLNLSDKNFTFFVAVFCNWKGGKDNSPKFINTSDYPSHVILTLEASIIDEKNNKKCKEYQRKTYRFPSDMIDYQWGKSKNNNWNNCHALDGSLFDGPPSTNKYVANQFNIKFDNIEFKYNDIINNFLGLEENNDIKIDQLKNYKINLKVYTETRVSFKGGGACMNELWLTPVLYYTDKNKHSYASKLNGITVEDNWDGITLEPTIFHNTSNSTIVAKTSNAMHPWMSFNYLDKLCESNFPASDDNTVTYGNLDLGEENSTTDPSTPKSDNYYIQNGFNGRYNGNNFDVTAYLYRTYIQGSTHVGNSTNINQHGLFIVDDANFIGGIYKKYNYKDINNDPENFTQDFYLFNTIKTDDGNEVKDVSITDLINAVDIIKDLQNSQSLLTYGV